MGVSDIVPSFLRPEDIRGTDEDGRLELAVPGRKVCKQTTMPAVDDPKDSLTAAARPSIAQRRASALTMTRSALAQGLVQPADVKAAIARGSSVRVETDVVASLSDRKLAASADLILDGLRSAKLEPETLTNTERAILRAAEDRGMIEQSALADAVRVGQPVRVAQVMDRLRFSAKAPRNEDVQAGIADGTLDAALVRDVRTIGIGERATEALDRLSYNAGAYDADTRSSLRSGVAERLICGEDVTRAARRGAVLRRAEVALELVTGGTDPSSTAIANALQGGLQTGALTQSQIDAAIASGASAREAEQRHLTTREGVLDSITSRALEGALSAADLPIG